MRVALTYDDGPDERTTPRLLDELRADRVTATFFVVGRAVDRTPALVRREAREGHAIGNHSYDHAHLEFSGAGKLRAELGRADAALARVGVATRLVRTPYGRRNGAIAQALAADGRTLVLWSDPESHDWERRDPRTIADWVVAHAHDGSIILLHDGDRGLPCHAAACDRSAVVAATHRIVADLRGRGMSFVPVTAVVNGR
jgi:peptidoglycan/xylan/chitin deacetylase (PgdA/CDA1 family)